MSQKFPQDEFDLAEQVGGRYRARRGKRDRFFEFLQVVAVGVVISAGGYFGLQLVASGNNLGSDAALNPTVVTKQFTKGGGVGVSVVDASRSKTAASDLAQSLLDKGWNVWSASQAVNAVNNPAAEKKTVVYAFSEASASVAKSLASSLGNFDTIVDPKYPDPVTIVLGTDYAARVTTK